MKKIFYSAASIMMLAACSEANIENQMGDVASSPLSITASSEVTSRVSVGDDWAVAWEDGDALLGYSIESSEFAKFAMTSYDAASSAFAGGKATDSYYVVYPYAEATANPYAIDLSTQHSGLKSTYLISEEPVSADQPTAAMKHIGAMMTLNINGADAFAGYTLKAVEVTGVKTEGKINFTEGTFETTNSGASMLVVVDENITITAGSVPSIKFNILPFGVEKDENIAVSLQLVGADGKDYTVKASSATAAEQINFDRAGYHTLNVTCDADSMIEGVKMSMVNTENTPEGSDWTIIDSDANNEIGGAKYDAMELAIKANSTPVNLTFANITKITHGAMMGCTNLAYVSGPKVEMLDYTAFKGCSDLTAASFPSVTVMGTNVFQNSAVTKLEVATTADVTLTKIVATSFGKASIVDLVIGRHNAALVSGAAGNVLTVDGVSATLKSIVDENGDKFVDDTTSEPTLPAGAVLLSSLDGTAATQPEGTEWVIYTNGDSSNFANLNAMLKLEANAKLSISITFPDLEAFPKVAFEKCKNLNAIVAPKVVSLGIKVFNGAAVKSVEIASAEGAKLKALDEGAKTASFGYESTYQYIELTMGAANAEFVSENTLTFSKASYAFKSITLK